VVGSGGQLVVDVRGRSKGDVEEKTLKRVRRYDRESGGIKKGRCYSEQRQTVVSM